MKTLAISITLGFLLYTRSVAAQTNLIFNGGFDTSAAGWITNTAPPGEGIGALWGGGSMEVFWSTGQIVEGLIPGNEYLLSWSSRGTYLDLGVRIDKVEYTVDGWANSNWEYFGFTFTATSSSVVLSFWTHFPSNPYHIDNVLLQPIYETPVPILQMFSTENWVALWTTGPSGQSVVLEASTNLVSWRPFATNAMPFFYSQIPKNPINTFYRASKPLL